MISIVAGWAIDDFVTFSKLEEFRDAGAFIVSDEEAELWSKSRTPRFNIDIHSGFIKVDSVWMLS